MKIIVKKYNEEPMVVERDEVTLDDMQEMVGGMIECLHVGGNVDMWLNDEGKLLDLPLNLILANEDRGVLDTIHGDIFFAGSDDSGELVGLKDGELTWIQNKLSCEFSLMIDEERESVRIIPVWMFDPTVS